MQGVQLGLPIVSSFGPQNIWDYTKETYTFLRIVCGAVQKGIEPKYEFNNEGNVDLTVEIRTTIIMLLLYKLEN